MEFNQRTLMQIADLICGNFKNEESFFRYPEQQLPDGVFSGLRH